MTTELMVSFNIGATGLGNLSGIYFYSYVAMQVPTGILADRIGRRKPLYVSGCIIGVLAWVVIIFVPELPLNVLTALFLCAGFASGCMIIGFAFVKESVPPFLAGTVSGIYNMGVMLGTMILQPAVGVILDLHSQGHGLDGMKQYSLHAYQLGFSLMLAWLVLGAVPSCLRLKPVANRWSKGHHTHRIP